jgi:hypothetical protein
MVAAGGDDRVAGGRDGLGDVETQAPACAGDEPNFLYSHGMFLNRTASDHKIKDCPANLTRRRRPAYLGRLCEGRSLTPDELQ